MRPSSIHRAKLLDAFKSPSPSSGSGSDKPDEVEGKKDEVELKKEVVERKKETERKEEVERKKEIWASSLSWVENGTGEDTGYDKYFVGGRANRVVSTHDHLLLRIELRISGFEEADLGLR